MYIHTYIVEASVTMASAYYTKLAKNKVRHSRRESLRVQLYKIPNYI